MAEEQNDLEKVQALLREQVDRYMAEQYAPRMQQQQRYTPSDAEIQQQQVANTVRGFVAPDLVNAQLSADDARDYVRFYTEHGDDAKDYGNEVEDTFTALLRAGRATRREDILDYVIGRERRTNPEKFNQKMEARQKAQLERASYAMDVGGNAVSREKAEKFKDFDKLSSDDMEKVLEGFTF